MKVIVFINASTCLQEILAFKSIKRYSFYNDFTGVHFRYIAIQGGACVVDCLCASATIIMGRTREEWKAMSYGQVIKLFGK